MAKHDLPRIFLRHTRMEPISIHAPMRCFGEVAFAGTEEVLFYYEFTPVTRRVDLIRPERRRNRVITEGSIQAIASRVRRFYNTMAQVQTRKPKGRVYGEADRVFAPQSL